MSLSATTPHKSKTLLFTSPCPTPNLYPTQHQLHNLLKPTLGSTPPYPALPFLFSFPATPSLPPKHQNHSPEEKCPEYGIDVPFPPLHTEERSRCTAHCKEAPNLPQKLLTVGEWRCA